MGNINRQLQQLGVETVTYTLPRQGGFEFVLDRERMIFKGVNLVRNFGTWSTFNHGVAVKARQAKIPQIFSPLGMLEPWAMAQKRRKKWLGWTLYQRRDIQCSAAVHATAKSEAENLRALGIKTPIAVIPHGIDIPVDRPKNSQMQRDAGQRIILFMSRIHPKKGLLELVNACARLKIKNWRVIIAGPDFDGYQSVIERAVQSAQLQDKFDFVGPVYEEHQKADLFSKADLFVLPTHSENFGLVVPEALAYGVPVITTTGTPWSELNQLACGWWIPLQPASLELTLVEALGLSSAELSAMGARGRRMVEERYAWPTIMQKHIALHEWVLGGGQRPSFFIG